MGYRDAIREYLRGGNLCRRLVDDPRLDPKPPRNKKQKVRASVSFHGEVVLRDPELW